MSDNAFMARVVVIGTGGVGSWLADGLVRQLAYSRFGGNCALVLLDGDAFEPPNRSRQSFTRLGNKAEVKASEIQALFPEVFVVPMAKWIVEAYPDDYDPTGPDADLITPADLFCDGDIIFAVVDNHATRKLVFAGVAGLDNVDCYTGGNDDAYFGSIYHYRRRQGADVTDPPFDYHPELVHPSDRNPALLSCGERAALSGQTQLIATNMAVAAWLLARFSSDIIADAATTSAEVMFDLMAGSATAYDRAAETAGQTEEKEAEKAPAPS